MDRGRLEGLDGLRGIAALCVFLSHIFPELLGKAYLAVDFFFMLSGYVMARSSEEALRSGGRGAAWIFLTRRVRRLYPTVFLGSLVGIPWLIATTGSQAPVLAITCLLLIPYDGPDGTYMLNPPVWSIAFELVANIFHAAFLARQSQRGLVVICVALFACLVFATWHRGLGFFPSFGINTLVLVRVLLPYTIGILLYRSWQDRPPFPVPGILTWLAMPVFFVAIPQLFGTSGPADFMFVLILCPVLVAGGLRNGQGSRLAREAGALSFPLYAVHGPVLLSLIALGAGKGWLITTGLGAGLIALKLSRWASSQDWTSTRIRSAMPTPPA